MQHNVSYESQQKCGQKIFENVLVYLLITIKGMRHNNKYKAHMLSYPATVFTEWHTPDYCSLITASLTNCGLLS